MTLLWHLARKDIRAARLPLLIWIALSVSSAIVQIREAPMVPGPGLLGLGPIGEVMTVVLGLGTIGAVLMIVSSVVHADPLVDPRAFWLTRPIPPRRLFLSKLLTIGALVLGPPIVIESVVLVWQRVPAMTIAHLAFEMAFVTAIPAMVLFVVASVTADTRRYMLLVTCAFGAALLGSAFLVRLPDSGPGRVPDVRFADSSAPLVLVSSMMAALALIVRRHYVRRDWLAAVASAIVAIAGTFAVGRLWPPELSLLGAERTPDAALARPDVTRLRRDGDALHVTIPGIEKSHKVAAPLVLDGLPADYTAAPFTLSGEITYADGTVIRSGRAALVQMEATGPFRPSATLSYGRLRLASGPTGWEGWPTLIEIPAVVLADRTNEPGRYVGTFRYHLSRHEPLAVLPLQAGAAYVDGPRQLVIEDVRPAVNGCKIQLEVTAPDFVLHAPREVALGFHFVDRQTGARLRTVVLFTPSLGRASLFNGTAAVARARSRHEVIVDAVDMTAAAQPKVPVRRTCEDTQLVVVRTTPAGALTRTLEIPDLRIGPAEQAALTRSR